MKGQGSVLASPTNPIQRQSAPGRLVGTSFGPVAGNLPLERQEAAQGLCLAF